MPALSHCTHNSISRINSGVWKRAASRQSGVNSLRSVRSSASITKPLSRIAWTSEKSESFMQCTNRCKANPLPYPWCLPLVPGILHFLNDTGFRFGLAVFLAGKKAYKVYLHYGFLILKKLLACFKRQAILRAAWKAWNGTTSHKWK